MLGIGKFRRKKRHIDSFWSSDIIYHIVRVFNVKTNKPTRTKRVSKEAFVFKVVE